MFRVRRNDLRLLVGCGAAAAIAVVHAETSTGVLQPLDDIAKVVRESGAHYVIDDLRDFPAVVADVNRRLASGENP